MKIFSCPPIFDRLLRHNSPLILVVLGQYQTLHSIQCLANEIAVTNKQKRCTEIPGDYINVTINGKSNCHCLRGVEKGKKNLFIPDTS